MSGEGPDHRGSGLSMCLTPGGAPREGREAGPAASTRMGSRPTQAKGNAVFVALPSRSAWRLEVTDVGSASEATLPRRRGPGRPRSLGHGGRQEVEVPAGHARRGCTRNTKLFQSVSLSQVK